MTLLAFHNDPALAYTLIAQLQAHYDADEIVKGVYWENGKGCAVGCALHSNNHQEGEDRYGIPLMLWKLQDCIFEGMPNKNAKEFPLRFARASYKSIGKDLSMVGFRFLHWLVSEELPQYFIGSSPEINSCRDAIAHIAQLLYQHVLGKNVGSKLKDAADAAARAAMRAADAAARAAMRAADATRAAADAAYQRMADKLIQLIEEV